MPFPVFIFILSQNSYLIFVDITLYNLFFPVLVNFAQKSLTVIPPRPLFTEQQWCKCGININNVITYVAHTLHLYVCVFDSIQPGIKHIFFEQTNPFSFFV